MSPSHTIFVQRRLRDDLTAVVDQLLAELFGKLVGLATLRVALIDIVLHIGDEFGVSTVHDLDAASSNFSIDSGEATKDDVVEHEKGILTDPVPRRVEVASLEDVEGGLDTIDVHVAVLS